MTDAPAAPSPDLEPLLRPISPDTPSGRGLRYEPLYEQIREARREEDPTLPQGVWQAPLKRANWTLVAELCQRALTHESKDLQLAAWLTEAWLAQHGFAGAEQGLKLILGLVEGFWDTLWPALQDGDAEARLASLEWLDDKLPIALGRVPLVRARSPDALTLGFEDWRKILAREKQGPRETDASATEGDAPGTTAPTLTRERFLADAALMPATALDALAQQISATLSATTMLELVLDSKLGQASALLRRTRSALGEIQTLLETLRAQSPREAPPRPPEATPAPEDAAALPPLPAPGRIPGSIQGRGEAYQLLALAADYLLRTEPHSPVPYLVRRAMSWGQLPLDKLLVELVPGSSDVEAIHALLGMKQKA